MSSVRLHGEATCAYPECAAIAPSAIFNVVEIEPSVFEIGSFDAPIIAIEIVAPAGWRTVRNTGDMVRLPLPRVYCPEHARHA